MTFVVRVVTSSAGTHAVVERVRTGRKTRVDTVERVGEVIAAMVAAELVTTSRGRSRSGGTESTRSL